MRRPRGRGGRAGAWVRTPSMVVDRVVPVHPAGREARRSAPVSCCVRGHRTHPTGRSAAAAPGARCHVTRARARVRCETCQRRASRSMSDRAARNTAPRAAVHRIVAHSTSAFWPIARRPAAPRPAVRLVAALGVERRGEGEAEVVAGGGEDRRQRRRQPQPPQHLQPAGVDRCQQLAGRRVGRAHPGDGGEHERRRRHEGDEEDHRRVTGAEPQHDRREVGDPRRHQHPDEHRLGGLLQEPRRRQHGADRHGDDERDGDPDRRCGGPSPASARGRSGGGPRSRRRSSTGPGG